MKALRVTLIAAVCAFVLTCAITAHANTLAAGASHTVVVTPNGSVWTWGANGVGQLGDGTNTSHTTPAAVPLLTDVVHVAAGANHTLVLRADGTVWAFGSNAYGQLGDGSTTNRNAPVLAIGLTGVVAIAAGDNHSVALTSDSHVWTWGRNTNGQLGDGTTAHANQPLVVSTTLTASAIGAGANHTLVVKTDSTVWGWGANANGQLGDASTTPRTSPVQMSGITTAVAVAGGGTHSLVRLSDGTVKAAGYNLWGQLGDGTSTQRTSPVSVSSLTSVSAIAAGADHSYALRSDGTVRAWGANFNGQLGDGTTTNRNTPVPALNLATIALLASGQNHGLAVTTTTVVWTWGSNAGGQLGDGTTQTRSTPVSISGADYAWKVGTPVFSVAAGTYTTEKAVVITCATAGAEIHYTLDGAEPTETDPLMASGSSVTIDQSRTLKARAWKSGLTPSSTTAATYTLAVAALTVTPGGGTYTSAQSVTLATSSPGATIRYTLDGTTPTETSTVYTTALSIGTSTTVKAIGMRTGWTSSAVASPTYTMNFGTLAAPVLSPGTGTSTSEAVVTMTAFETATIRYTTNGSTPTSSSTAYTAPLTIAATTTIKAKAFHPDYTTSPESSATYTIVVATPSLTPTEGTYAAGELITVSTATAGATLTYTLNGATPTITDQTVPSGGTLVMGNFTVKVAAWKTGCTPSAVAAATYRITGTVTDPRLAGGLQHSLLVRGDSVTWAWGDNPAGQLGDGSTTDRLLPVIAGGMTGAVTVAAGDLHSLAVRTDATVFAWGSNTNGRLGDGTTTARLVPTPVPNFTGAVSAAAGASHSLALKSDGSAWGWGNNSLGQLGDGTTTQRLTPTPVSGLSSVTAMATRGSSSYALRADGVLWAWGGNSNGQLGDGTTTTRTSPVQVSGITTGSAMAAGSFHAVALLADGTVRAWGYNADGQVGDGTFTQRTTPVTVTGLTGITQVAAGGSHSLALDSSGGVWAWGSNANGAIGDGTSTNRSSPVSVAGLPIIIRIAAGAYHSLAIGQDHSVWAWGRNVDGQVGDGTTTTRTTPVEIAGPGVAWKVASPALSLATGTYPTAQTVTVTIADPEAVMHYTTTGVDPAESDTVIASGGTVGVEQSLTLKVRAWKPGAVTSEVVARTYELRAVAPTLTPAPGQYGPPQSVTMSTPTSGATIRYTLDGTEPSSASSAYSAPVVVADTRTVKGRTYKTGWTPSDSVAVSYWITAGTVATPTLTPAAGSYTSAPLVALATATTGATLRYTLDGTDPTEASSRYEYPFLVTVTATVTARAFKTGYTSSAVASAAYALDAAGQTGMPTIVPGGGPFATTQTVTIAGPAGATLRYTTTGVDPTDIDPLVPAGGLLAIDRATILKVRAWSSGLTPSVVRRADVLVTGAIAAGDQHSLALTASGDVLAWGRGSEGQLGDGTAQDRTTPVTVLTGATAIAAGDRHSLAVLADGTVRGWGSNGGRLGNGSTGSALSPVQAVGLTDVIAVAAGVDHSLALKRDGTVWAVGANGVGQLGDGTTTNTTTAVQVVGLSGMTAIAAGEGFSLALQRDGAAGGILWAWGQNPLGQLGDGSTQTRLTPVQVIGLTDVVQIAAGPEFAVARLADGTVRVWGANASAQLGNLSGGFSAVPVVVPALADITAIAAGRRHALAVDGEGRTWGWGANTNSQLGTPNYVGASGSGAPQLLPGGTAGIAAAGGWQHTLVLRADGSLWATGGLKANGLGGAQIDELTPIPNLSLVSNAWLLTDLDGDGLPSWHEYAASTDPLVIDSNGNGLSDLVDVRRRTQSGNPDDDGDGVPNAVEIAQGTDPFRADTDGDGVSDRLDAYPLDPTRSQAPSPDPNDTTPPTITLTEPTSARPIGGGGN